MKTSKETEFHLKLGLKLWTSNVFFIKPALELYQKEIFDYVELYVDPDSEKENLDQWRGNEFPFILHAPHSYSGLNFSQEKRRSENRSILEEVETYRLALNPKYVIFHPGIQGSNNETIFQINNMKERFPALFNLALIENKPKMGIKGEVCLGASPEEIERIMKETGLGFCLDVGHAICYAAWAQTGWEEVVNQFVKFEPKVFHLSDGDINSVVDAHLNYGDGNFALNKLINLIPSGAYVSVETDKDPKLNLKDFESDIFYLKNLNGIYV